MPIRPGCPRAAFVLALIVAAVTAGCAQAPAQFARDAARQGYASSEVDSGVFRHVVYYKGAARADRPLTVYIDGDGDPSAGLRGRVEDPTTRERLILRLMAADPAVAVLVGRPCYYGRAHDPGCDPRLWTSHRYAPEVVSAMAVAINRVLAGEAHGPVTLVGYSGGGALALLVAPRLSRLDRLITIAANVDLAAWAAHHGEGAPSASLDPAEAPPLAARVIQHHFYGAEDRTVPAATARAALSRQPAAAMHVIAGYDHRCCWADIWADILAGWTP